MTCYLIEPLSIQKFQLVGIWMMCMWIPSLIESTINNLCEYYAQSCCNGILSKHCYKYLLHFHAHMLYHDLIWSINVYYYYWCGDKLNCNNSTSSRCMRHRVFVFFGSRIRLNLAIIRQALYNICICTLCTMYWQTHHSFYGETECDKATSSQRLTQPTLDRHN